ncbi:hypothetical protein D3C72_2384360 [compost metagenome]
MCLCCLPSRLVGVELHSVIGEFASGIYHGAGPGFLAVHRFRAHWRRHIRRATEHRIDNFALDTGTET